MPEPLNDEQRKLVEDNIELAHKLTHAALRRMPVAVEMEEVRSAAYQGLVIAARNFSPEEHGRSPETIDSGKAFSSYARRRILGSILDWQRTQDHVPRRQRKIYKELVEKGYESGTPLAEAADALNVTIERAKEIILRVSNAPVYLDHGVTDGMDPSSYELSFKIPSVDDTEDSSLSKRISAAMTKEWMYLPDDEQLIIALRYYAEIPLASIASLMGLTLAVTKEKHDEAVLALHGAMLTEAREVAGG